jgi:hypothetical protein
LIAKVAMIRKKMRRKDKHKNKGMEKLNNLTHESRRSSVKSKNFKMKQSISRYSNVNVAMLGAMRTTDTQQGEELENTLSKQTKLEERVSMLTIKRTMT